jgi:hypothetical protein
MDFGNLVKSGGTILSPLPPAGEGRGEGGYDFRWFPLTSILSPRGEERYLVSRHAAGGKGIEEYRGKVHIKTKNDSR